MPGINRIEKESIGLLNWEPRWHEWPECPLCGQQDPTAGDDGCWKCRKKIETESNCYNCFEFCEEHMFCKLEGEVITEDRASYGCEAIGENPWFYGLMPE